MVKAHLKSSVLLLTAAIVIGATACDIGRISYEIDYDGDKLVLNAIVSNVGVEARLTRSQDPALDSRANLAVDGEVWLCDSSGQYVASLLDKGNGDYMLALALCTGCRYSLKARAPGFEEVFSEAVAIPPGVSPNWFSELRTGQMYGRNVYLLDFEFTDDASTTDFYFYNAYAKRDGIRERRLSFWEDVDENFAELCNFELIVPDQCFSGQTYIFQGVIGSQSLPDSLFVEFGTANAGFYDYVSSLSGQPELDLLLFQQPFPILSNVSGGYGMVVAKHTYFYEFGN